MNTKNINKDRALYFSKFSDLYDEVRPGYSDDVYQEILKYLKVQPNLNFMEIGAGNGVATQEINRIWKPNLTLIEPGRELCDLLETRFQSENNIEIINDYFENVTFEKESFDAIFSATAFHWLDKKRKYRKSHELLRENGLLVLFWNNYLIDDPEVAFKIQKVYRKYGYVKSNYCIYKRQAETIEYLKNEIVRSKFFELLVHKLFVTPLEFSSAKYIKLLKTYPSHASYSDIFFDEIAKIIMADSDRIVVRITTNVEIAKKV